jgi:phosphopantetheinyl transferase (holo-ACP synthase)
MTCGRARVGIDVTSAAEWRARLARTPALRTTAFAAGERAWCGSDPRSYALAWATKEAAVKLLGTGFDGVGWRGIWSRPVGDDGIEVVIADGARDAAPLGELAGPLWYGRWSDGDDVIVALAAGCSRVVVRALPIGHEDDRRARHRSSRRAARRAAMLAAAPLTPFPGAVPTWTALPDQPPVTRWPDGTATPTSVAHGSRLVCAAAGDGAMQSYKSSPLGLSTVLTFWKTDEYAEGSPPTR